MTDSDSEDIIVLVAEGKEIIASKDALSRKSPHFASMFSLPMKESTEKRILIQDAPFNCLDTVVNFDFEKLTKLDIIEAIDSLFLADRFQFDYLISVLPDQICRKASAYVWTEVEAWEVLLRREYLMSFKLNPFIEAVYHFIDNAADAILVNPGTKDIPIDILIDVLKRDTFAVSEDKILRFVLDYLTIHPSSTPGELLKCIRMNLVLEDEVEQLVKDSPYEYDLREQSKKSFQRRYHRLMNQNLYQLFGGCLQEQETNLAHETDFKVRKHQERIYREFVLEFKEPVCINTITFRLCKRHNQQRNVYFQFILDITKENDHSKETLVNTISVYSQHATDGQVLVEFSQKVINGIRLRVNPSGFAVTHFDCRLVPEMLENSFDIPFEPPMLQNVSRLVVDESVTQWICNCSLCIENVYPAAIRYHDT